MISYSTQTNNINWKDAVNVFLRAPLGQYKRDPDQLKSTFESSDAAVSAYYLSGLIGMGRAVCNGRHQGTIYDVALLPEYQGRGIGREIVLRLCKQLPVKTIMICPVPGSEGFYEKCGFNKTFAAMALLTPVMSRERIIPHTKKEKV